MARCRRHDQAFTLYPPGYAPYARSPVAAVAPDGDRIRGGADRGAERFRGTLFDAALDAAAGRAWPREHVGPLQKWWRTQLRRLALATYLVGVAPELSTRRREQIAQLLSVDVLVLHEQARRLRTDGGYRQRGEAVRRVLAVVPRGRFLPERLLECGHIVQRWGAPYRWLSKERSLRRQPFRSAPGMARAIRPP